MTIKPVIYISSTFFDLQEHRSVLTEALRNAKVFDVRGMENYGTISSHLMPALMMWQNQSFIFCC